MEAKPVNYVVLARRWRPQRFAEVVGQESITRTLANSIASGRIAHAFIFSGPRGVGKTTTARLLAKALNCERGPTPEPCNECVHCVEITEGRSLDVQELDAATHTGVDDVRQLTETMTFAPARDRFRIYIIDEVHMLSRSAFNALLKTIEEPPPHGKFILATTEIQKVPATILSRCQRYEFRRVPVATTLAALGRIRDSEGFAIDDGALELVARMAEGSMRDAESLLDQVIAYSGGQADEETVRRLLGKLDPALLAELFEAVAAGDGARAAAVFGRYMDEGGDPTRFVMELLAYLRDLALVRATGSALAALSVPAARLEAMKALAARLPLEAWGAMFRVVSEGERDVKEAADPRLTVDMLLLEMAGLPNLMPLAELVERLGTARPLSSTAPARPLSSAAPTAGGSEPLLRDSKAAAVAATPAALALPVADPSEPPPPARDFDLAQEAGREQFWAAVIEDLAARRRLPLRSAVDQGTFPVELAGGALVIEVAPAYAGQVREPARWEALVQSAARVLGRPLALTVRPGGGTDSLARRRQAGQAARQLEIAEEARAHPRIRSLLDGLQAEIESVEERPRQEGDEECSDSTS